MKNIRAVLKNPFSNFLIKIIENVLLAALCPFDKPPTQSNFSEFPHVSFLEQVLEILSDNISDN